ncbi:MAG: PKD domain-containing protein [Candidatus Bathyarchaeia archaeon]|jgi:hypothetical protein
MSKLRIAVIALCLVATIGSAFALAVTAGGFRFLVYQSDTGSWNINLGASYFEEPKSFKVTVESKDSTGTFAVVYFLTVNGPKGLSNDDLSLYWVDTDGASFTIGKGGSQTFSGTGTLSWNGVQTVFEAGHKNNITLTLTFHPTAPVGAYEMNMWAAFTPAISVTISPSCATLYVGQCQLFTSSVTAGSSPYTYQWYLNGAPVSGATKTTWTFTPTSAGCYTVYVKVTDSTGTQATSNTATVTVEQQLCVSPSSVVVRGMDNSIYYRAWNGTGWEGWLVLPGATCDSPAAAMLGKALHIVVRGMDGNTLWYGCLSNPADPCSFSGWTLLSGSTQSAPTLTSNGNMLCLVVRGLDDRIYYRWYSGGCWGSWSAVPTGATCDSPATVLLGNDLHIVVRGMDGSSLWDTIVDICDGTVVRGWSLLSGATPSKPVLACSSSGNLYLVVRGMDNAIYYRSYTGSTNSWAGWSAFPTGATNDGPAATMVGNMLCTVVRGSDGSTLWCGDIDLGTTSFTGWTLVSGATPSAPTLTS